MQSPFSRFLLEQSWMKVVRVLYSLRRPSSLREIVDVSQLSPAGVLDVLRRLEEIEVVKGKKKGNRILYSLKLNEAEKEFIGQIIEQQTCATLQQRAVLFSKRYRPALSWNDQTIKAIRQGKRKLNDAS